jgi:hypothetical protein
MVLRLFGHYCADQGLFHIAGHTRRGVTRMYPNRRRQSSILTPPRRLKLFLKAWLPWGHMAEGASSGQEAPGGSSSAGQIRLPSRRARYNRRDCRGPWVRTHGQIPPTR